tara:strand:- start:114 stop:416 length:303 start_codon:yes stop_codon:yes gene_type:complete
VSKEKGNFYVLNPIAEKFPIGGSVSTKLDTLEGKTIVFLDNNKLQPYNKYFSLMGDLLKEKNGVKDIIHVKKPFFTRPARPDILEQVVEHADAAVTGLGE